MTSNCQGVHLSKSTKHSIHGCDANGDANGGNKLYIQGTGFGSESNTVMIQVLKNVQRPWYVSHKIYFNLYFVFHSIIIIVRLSILSLKV